MHIINNQTDLENFCTKLKEEDVIFMDTEFHRKKTYYAKLSIIQIATKTERAIIDCLLIEDLTSIKEILLNKNIVKVFHAPDQDFGIFLHIFKKLPINIFDTQTAAGVIGLDSIIGYARLCKTLLHVNIDKTMQDSNWLKRPLTKPLLEYAIKDVEYLIPLYRELTKTINDRNLWDAYNSRSKKFLDIKNYKINPDKIIRRMNLIDKSNQFINNLKYFIHFREECAQMLNVPRAVCATDYDLIEICKYLPKNKNELFKLQINYKPIARRKFQTKLLELCSGMRA